MSVSSEDAPSFVTGERRKLLDLAADDSGDFHEFDVSADGQKFLLIQTEADSHDRRVILFPSEWELRYFERHHPDVTLFEESPGLR